MSIYFLLLSLTLPLFCVFLYPLCAQYLYVCLLSLCVYLFFLSIYLPPLCFSLSRSL
uniref:Uncharacterized protein n=1 Tax=Arundo donax TaxID=35708 RepID=A0A0A9I0S3_ARUDO